MPMPEPTDAEIHWAAGFLEGEGYFSLSRNKGWAHLGAGQKQREPLDRLEDILGGHVRAEKSGDFYRWTSGARADVDRIIEWVYPLMSSRRRGQIDKMLAGRNQNRKQGHNHRKTHCPRGHPYDLIERIEDGYSRNRRRCSICLRRQMIQSNARQRERRKVARLAA